MENQVRRRLEDGQRVLGMMHFTASPMIVEVMARGGLDFAIVDMEHSPTDLGVAAHIIRAADAACIAPFVRVPEVDAGLIKKVLNLGAQGIVIPHATRASCEAAVQAVRYAPEGIRGSCPAIRAAGYGQPDWAQYTARANREVLVIPLLEEKATIDDIEALVAMPGVDIFFLGPFDLSVSIGLAGAGFEHPTMAAALDRVVALARAHRKYVMTSVGATIDLDYARNIFARGVQMISYSADALVFLEACRNIAALRTAN
ncbi:MAG: HpcH/HpaI aldolase family protein [Pseudomonadota bacterium]